MRIDEGGNAEGFIYNQDGQRVSIWNMNSGVEIRGDTYWGGLPVEFNANGHANYVHADWRGTDQIYTGYNGNLEATVLSLPFGDGSGTAGSTDSPWVFAQMDKDYYNGADSGTDRALYREYSDGQGNWMSPDRYSGSYDFSNPQSLNRYSYVMNNPLAFRDPLGLQCVPVGTAGAVECTASLVFDGAAAASGSGSLAWLGSLGGFFSNPFTAGIVGGGLGIYELGKLFGWWSGQSFHGSLQPRPNAPSNTRNCKTGFGIGVTAGADATAGLGYGAGANGSVGAGVFAGNGLNAGAFASGGAGASAFGHGASAPSANLIGRFFAGLVGGAGAGVFVTNASQASQLRGNGGSWTIDFGDVINGAGQFSAGTDAAGNSIWSFSFTLGVGLGAGYQQLTNRTATVGRGGC